MRDVRVRAKYACACFRSPWRGVSNPLYSTGARQKVSVQDEDTSPRPLFTRWRDDGFKRSSMLRWMPIQRRILPQLLHTTLYQRIQSNSLWSRTVSRHYGLVMTSLRLIEIYGVILSCCDQGVYRTGVEARYFASKKFFDNVRNALSTSFL